MARDMTAAEKASFKNDFPNLNVNRENIVTAELTMAYNCYSWSVGITTRWIQFRTIRCADRFYMMYGFSRVRGGRGRIAVMGANFLDVKHGFKKVRGTLPRWSSKCGSSLRISHKLKELEGGSYGRLLAFYDKRRLPVPGGRSFRISTLATDILNETVMPAIELSKKEQKILKQDLKSVPDKLREKFATRFDAWKSSWNDAMRFSSHTSVLTCSDAFYDLLALGGDILPLVINELCDPDNFPALQLYELLQINPDLVYEYEDNDETLIEGEQGRAVNTVRLWLDNR